MIANLRNDVISKAEYEKFVKNYEFITPDMEQILMSLREYLVSGKEMDKGVSIELRGIFEEARSGNVGKFKLLIAFFYAFFVHYYSFLGSIEFIDEYGNVFDLIEKHESSEEPAMSIDNWVYIATIYTRALALANYISDFSFLKGLDIGVFDIRKIYKDIEKLIAGFVMDLKKKQKMNKKTKFNKINRVR